jgi:hypothetical protein
MLDKYFEYIGSGDPVLIQIAASMNAHWAGHSEILAEQQIRQAIATGGIKREDLESSEEKEDAKPAPPRGAGS